MIASLALAALAGLATSFGPCVAPRYLALATMVGGRGSWLRIATFTAGIVIAYVTLGTTAGALATIAAHTAAIDLAFAGVLVASGIATLLRDPQCAHGGARVPASAGGAFALGAGSVLVLSPCCSPLLAAFVGLGAFARDPLWAAAALAAFALGHAVPLALTGLLGGGFARRSHALAATGAPAVVAGTLLIALGGYYGMLA